MQLDLLCETKNGKRIYYDPTSSHAATHFNDAPQLREVVKNLLGSLNVNDDRLGFDTVTGKPIGNMDVVEVGAAAEIIYAKRKNRNEYVPFVKNRSPEPSTYVSINLLPRGNDYELQSAWIGPFDSPPFPGEPNATIESIPFWNRHAFVWGTQGVQEDTITTTCAW